jgi:hypothetical protein
MTTRKRAANGSGSVFLRTDGRWCAALYVTEADGRRIRRRVYGKSRKEVEGRLVELRAKAEAGRQMTPADLTLEAYLNEWLSQIVAQRVRPNTLAAYATYVDRYLVPDLGKRKLGRLTAREVQLYLDSLRRRDVGVRTIRYVHATLRAALEDAMREELLEKNVAKLVRPPTVAKGRARPAHRRRGPGPAQIHTRRSPACLVRRAGRAGAPTQRGAGSQVGRRRPRLGHDAGTTGVAPSRRQAPRDGGQDCAFQTDDPTAAHRVVQSGCPLVSAAAGAARAR